MTNKLLIAMLAGLLIAPNAFGIWGWMRGAAVGDFNDADWELLKATAGRAFDEAADGERVNWRNDATGSSGAIKPLMTIDHELGHCRRVAFLNVSAKGERGVSTHSLCRQADGAWKFVSDSELNQE